MSRPCVGWERLVGPMGTAGLSGYSHTWWGYDMQQITVYLLTLILLAVIWIVIPYGCELCEITFGLVDHNVAIRSREGMADCLNTRFCPGESNRVEIVGRFTPLSTLYPAPPSPAPQLTVVVSAPEL